MVHETWESLANAIGTSRRSIQEWRGLAGAPSSKSESDWLPFIRSLRLGPYGDAPNAKDPKHEFQDSDQEEVPDTGKPIEEMTERELKVEERREKLLLARSKRLREEEKWIPKEEAQAAFSIAASGFRAAGDRMPVRASSRIKARSDALYLAFFRKALPADISSQIEAALEQSPMDFAEIVQILEESWQEILKSIHHGGYLEAASE